MDDIGILFGGGVAGSIGTLQLHATLSETHDYTNNISEFPIEDGSDINDHVKINPDEVVINGFITETPISSNHRSSSKTATLNANNEIEFSESSSTSDGEHVKSALDELLSISGRKINGKNTTPKIVTIVTGLRVYTNMMMSSLSVPRQSNTGKAMRFTARFRQTETVDTETILIQNPKKEDRDKTFSTVDKGKQNPKESNATKKAKAVSDSLLFKGYTKVLQFSSF